MILSVKSLYKLKEGAEPVLGYPDYGTTDLEILEVDLSDDTVMVRPEGFSLGAFWARAEDLEEMR